MDENTKMEMLQKIATIAAHIAYPSELLRGKELEEYYRDLHLSMDNHLQDVLNVNLFNTEISLSKLREPINQTNWISHGLSTFANAYYSPDENSIGKYSLTWSPLRRVFFLFSGKAEVVTKRKIP